MEAAVNTNKSFTQPKTMAELLPGLRGLLSSEDMHTLTVKKLPRATMAVNRTAEKAARPLTIAQMRADLRALKVQSPRGFAQPTTSNKKKNWNSSVKVDKKISHTADGQLKNHSVRKVLNFQPKSKTVINSRVTLNPTTPKFQKPEIRPKKSVHIQAKSTVRISGVCTISETPVVIQKPAKSRMTIAVKENVPRLANINKKVMPPLKPLLIHKKLIPPIVSDTPLSNESWKSSCDGSFLQKEKEIQDVEDKAQAVAASENKEQLAQLTPPVSTPFKEYRNVNEYFNNSSIVEESSYQDNTIMFFDKPAGHSDSDKREESVIVSLCDLLNKATVTSSQPSTELDDLLKFERQTEHNIKMIDNGIQMLKKIKDSHLQSLVSVRKLIEEKKSGQTSETTSEVLKDKTAVDLNNTIVENNKVLTPKQTEENENMSIEKSPILRSTVIKSCVKSPTYKIPRKSMCLRKKVYYKSMPNVSTMLTPEKDLNNKALNMYMKMKEQMNFLTTPQVNKTSMVPDTPALTSHNLQKQLNQLFGS